MLVYEVGSNKPGKVFATGIRNCVGLTIQPVKGDLWCTTNERDMLGDDLVPDYSTRVKEGAFYGWPWMYMGKYEDPRHAGERPDLVGKVTERYADIHMPRNTAVGLIMGLLSLAMGFGFIWHIWWLGIAAFAGMIVSFIVRSFDEDTDYYVPAAEVERIENQRHVRVAQLG